MGCNSNKQTENKPFPDSIEIVGLASPYTMNEGANTIYLADFFLHPEMIDSVSCSVKANDEFFPDKSEVVIVQEDNLPNLFLMHVWIGADARSIVVRKSQKVEIEFSFDPRGKTYKSVQVAGEVNAWNPLNSDMELENGIWKIRMKVNPGKYQYQLVLDGKWILDPANPDSVSNNIGGFNSLIVAGEDYSDQVPFIFTDQYDEKGITTGFKNEVDGWIALWQNFDITGRMEGNKIPVPAEAVKLKRSYIRVFAFNNYGVSNDLLIPLEYGKVVNNANQLDRTDYHAMVLYNVFVDRFFDGDSSNDKPLHIPEVKPKADNMGGDIKGIEKVIDEGYFTDLGVNSIWLSPVVKNAQGAWGLWPKPKSKFSGYHGYWPVSFTEIDDRFGTKEDLKDLVEKAHQKNMNLLLDFVANHVHQDHPVYKSHPDWATDLYLPDGSLNTERWDDHRLTTWFDVFLPTLDLSKPEVYNMLSDSAVWWIKSFGLDGFRHDATKHIPEVFWRTLTRKLKNEVIVKEDRPLYQIGETYGTRELIGSYVNSGELDAQFDFNVYDASVAAFAKDDQPLTSLSESLKESFKYFGWHHLMGNISGNQDRGRFISYAGGSLKFDEDAKMAGWTRDITVGEETSYEKLKLLFAFNFTIPGVPVIYYGDEIGMPGGNDPDNRRMMRFDNLTGKELDVRNTVAQLARLRTEFLPLVYGEFKEILVDSSTWVYMRCWFGQAAVVVLNKSGENKTVNFILDDHLKGKNMKAAFDHEFSVENNKVGITMPPYSFEILIIE